MINLEKIAKEIIAAAPSPIPEVEPEVKEPVKEETVTTSIPQDQIDDALELANFAKERSQGLLTEANAAIENLSGEGKASVLESKDDFHTLVLRLKQMKRRLSVV